MPSHHTHVLYEQSWTATTEIFSWYLSVKWTKKTETIYHCASLAGSFPEETCEKHTDKCNWGLLSNHMHCFLLCFNQDLKYNGFAAKLFRMLIHSGHIDSGQCQIAYYHRLRCLSFCNVMYSFMIRVACFFKQSIYIWDMESNFFIFLEHEL